MRGNALASAEQNHRTTAANLRRHSLPEEGFVRLPTILQVIPVSRATWWAGIAAGKYPKPVHLGPQLRAWRVQDIRTLIAQLSETA